jgi:hypothetical protein
MNPKTNPPIPKLPIIIPEMNPSFLGKYNQEICVATIYVSPLAHPKNPANKITKSGY